MINTDKIKEAGKYLKYLGIAFFIFNLIGCLLIGEILGGEWSIKRTFIIGIFCLPIFMIAFSTYQAGKCLMKASD